MISISCEILGAHFCNFHCYMLPKILELGYLTKISKTFEQKALSDALLNILLVRISGQHIRHQLCCSAFAAFEKLRRDPVS